MCINLQRLPEIDSLVPCRNCWQCRENRVSDLVGRCIAESHTAARTVAVTLTYAGDTPNSAVLVYADFQLFVKRLRAAGHSVRYIVAGEYGSKKGRAHWHAVLFFRDPIDLPPLDQRVEWPFWTNKAEGRGIVFFQEPDYDGFRYVLKYVLKDQAGKNGQSHLAMSKKPPLGYQYFMDLADQYVRERISPQHARYSFRGVKDSRGNHRRFVLQGRMRELFCQAFITRYRAELGRDYPFSDWLLEQENQWYRSEAMWSDAQWKRHLSRRAGLELPADVLRRIELGAAALPEGAGPVELVLYSDGIISITSEENQWLHDAADVDALSASLRKLGVFPASILPVLFNGCTTTSSELTSELIT